MKRKIINIAVALSISSVLCGTVLAYSSSDLIHLKNSILGTDDITESDDVNQDGVVNVFDMCDLKKSISSNGEFVTQNYTATSENVKLVGRTLRSDDITWLVQSGSAIEFTVSGKSAEITLAGDSSITNDEKYLSRYAVYVDDELVEDALMRDSEKKITLFNGETSKTVKVKIIHLSEAMDGAIGVKDISITSDYAIPITPEPKKSLSIEFIGDSITCAYGVEGASSSESFSTSTENFMKSYAYLTAQKLNADYSAVSYSGHGIISGYTSSGDINTDSLIPDCYELVGKLPAYATSWDFSTQSNDVVVINLGTNDSSYVSKDLDNRSDEFIEGYINFLKTVREKNPDAYIICTMGTMGGEEIYPLIEQAVEKYSSDENDNFIMSYQSATQNLNDGIGSDWHPSAVTQQNSAYVLADKICQALGIESDQVGLDIIADSEYTLDIDSDKGGNSAYYVGYDKSFWINTVTGGLSADAIQAVISDVKLKKNGTYRLEFDYTSSVEREIPLFISGSDGTKYFTSSFETSSDKKHFSEEFTVSINDNASLVFQLGGQDSYNVTLSNIKLTKIS